jgi:hypothetical protein
MYSIPAMCLSEKALYTIQQKATAKFLQLIGYEEKFPRAAVFGSYEYGGMELTHLYTESVCRKIECLTCHINANSELGKMIKININWQQLLCGTSTPFLESNYRIDYVKTNWFSCIKDFLNKTNSTIHIKNTWKPTLLRENDLIIMDEVIKLDIPPSHLEIFNNWRLYFQINTLSNMTNNSGNRIKSELVKRNHVDYFSTNSNLQWPIQARPSLHTFKIWFNIITKIIPQQEHGNINQPLGKWTKNYAYAMKINTVIHKDYNKLAVWQEDRTSIKITDKPQNQSTVKSIYLLIHGKNKRIW